MRSGFGRIGVRLPGSRGTASPFLRVSERYLAERHTICPQCTRSVRMADRTCTVRPSSSISPQRNRSCPGGQPTRRSTNDPRNPGRSSRLAPETVMWRRQSDCAALIVSIHVHRFILGGRADVPFGRARVARFRLREYKCRTLGASPSGERWWTWGVSERGSRQRRRLSA